MNLNKYENRILNRLILNDYDNDQVMVLKIIIILISFP